MPGSGLTESEVTAILLTLTEVGADPQCPSCQQTDWSGWDTGGIPRVSPHRHAGRLDENADLVDWAHGLNVSALMQSLRICAPALSGELEARALRSV